MPQPFEIKVLIAHSDPLISAGLDATLTKRPDFKVAVCNPESTVSHSTASHFPSPDVVVADYDSGLRLTALKEAWTDRVMILTHSDSEAKICHALEQGVRGYLLLGCRLEDLMQAIRSMHKGGIAWDPLVASRIAERMKQEALTRREEDILEEIMLGLSNKAIASKLAVAVGTVKTHVKSILSKLDAASRTEAVAIAQRRGILGGKRERRRRRVQEPPSGTELSYASQHPRRRCGSLNADATILAPAP
ncbi:MAG: Transcriptional regulator, LuxR family [Gammaproteobacteria bacterium]|jgi:DNA-binding NarL/FixJ family response regulator|nr:Transcriptional regulator, LuxR family [Gammaproteobacteria bacterium]